MSPPTVPNKEIDELFFEGLRKAGLWVVFLLALLAVLSWGSGLYGFSDFLLGMEMGALLMWLSLNWWAKAYFRAPTPVIGLRRMLWSFMLAMPLGILAAFWVVQFWPQSALGFGFGVCTPVFYAIWPAWRLREHGASDDDLG